MFFSRHIIKNMLLECGATMHEAISLSEGLELFSKITPSVIIIGASFANDQGLYFSQIIKRHDAKMKIIFIFKKAVEETVYNVFLSGGNALLVLPLNKERLISEISPQAAMMPYSNTINF